MSAYRNEQPLREEDEEDTVTAAALEICSAPVVDTGRTTCHRRPWRFLIRLKRIYNF
jgi:hypothetical protein